LDCGISRHKLEAGVVTQEEAEFFDSQYIRSENLGLPAEEDEDRCPGRIMELVEQYNAMHVDPGDLRPRTYASIPNRDLALVSLWQERVASMIELGDSGRRLYALMYEMPYSFAAQERE